MIRPKDLLFRLVLGIVISIILYFFFACKKEEPPKVESKLEQGYLITIDSIYVDTTIIISEN